MASLLGEHLFEISDQGPPPQKDFFQLLITKDEVEYLFLLVSIHKAESQKISFELIKPLCNYIEVIWRSWEISVRHDARGAAPKELKTSHSDFIHHKMLQRCAFHPSSVEQVGAVFGERILEHTRSLCQGKFDYLERLPDDIMLQILSYLELKDTILLAQASQRFRKLCNSEKFWEQTVRNRCDEFTCDMEGIGNCMGWRKMFFTFFHTSGREEQQ